MRTTAPLRTTAPRRTVAPISTDAQGSMMASRATVAPIPMRALVEERGPPCSASSTCEDCGIQRSAPAPAAIRSATMTNSA